jgi:hypothetical protein
VPNFTQILPVPPVHPQIFKVYACVRVRACARARVPRNNPRNNHRNNTRNTPRNNASNNPPKTRVFIGVSPAAPQAGEAGEPKARVFTGVSPAAPQAGEAEDSKARVFTGVSPAAPQAGEAGEPEAGTRKCQGKLKITPVLVHISPSCRSWRGLRRGGAAGAACAAGAASAAGAAGAAGAGVGNYLGFGIHFAMPPGLAGT